MAIILSIIGFFIVVVISGFFNLRLILSTSVLAAYILALNIIFGCTTAILIIDILFIAFAIVLNFYPIRRHLFSKIVFNILKKTAPKMSQSEEEAIKAGTLSFESKLFLGDDCNKELRSLKASSLSKEEREFLDGPVEDLCTMLDDYKILQDKVLSEKVWKFIKEKGFFSIIIPKKYGGLEFSAAAHAAIILKLGSRNLPAAITVAVPNSLGPAELLLEYGTKEQQEYYLPRLARGKEIPCFALTSPRAGSDAASMPDNGVICHGMFNNEKVLGIKLNWDKRYITLAPKATVLGLAFKLYDPDHLLSNKEDIGITCALIPSDLKGIERGTRHNPFDIPFSNGPTSGKDVFIPLDYVIGGKEMVGKGWKMLMECLGAGRAITLPSAGAGSAMAAALFSGCYARIRHQFGLPIGKFEGIKEALARIGAHAYVNHAALKFVTARIDEGAKPPIASAIMKYHTTERCRHAVNDAMDIHAGKSVCIGPKNYLTSLYKSLPVYITVEGANILTRSLIIFGQGYMRCHPYLLKEFDALNKNDLKNFDKILWSHLGFLTKNACRSFAYGIFKRLFIKGPNSRVKTHYKKLTHLIANFAFISDITAIMLGASLKRKENISARLGDILSYLYLASATLKRYHDDNEPKEDKVIVDYVCQDLFYNIEKTMIELCQNYTNKLVAMKIYRTIFPFDAHPKKPNDELQHKVADLMLSPSESFERLTDGLFFKKLDNNPLYTLRYAQSKVVDAKELEKRVRTAQKQGSISGLSETKLVKDAFKKGIINKKEADTLEEIAKLRAEIIAVDDFKEL